MAQFCFYSKNSPTQEVIGVVGAPTRDEAVRYFALNKMLSITDFLTIFEVKSYTHGTQEGIKEGTKQLLKG
jgi:hypothetical protein